MSVEFLLEFVQNTAFSIVMAVYLLVVTTKRISEVNNTINELVRAADQMQNEQVKAAEKLKLETAKSIEMLSMKVDTLTDKVDILLSKKD